MTKIRDIACCIESVAPLHYQENYDNSGLTIGNLDVDVTGVLVCLDVNEEVIEEAINNNCNVIIAHHPVIFYPLKKLTGTSYQEKYILKLIQNNIALYIAHTNLDNAIEGVNTFFAQLLDLQNISILRYKSDIEYAGAGAVGELKKSVTEAEFLSYIKQKLDLKCIRYSTNNNKIIKKVAVCGGSGAPLIFDAILKEADAIITSDVKYHDFLDAKNKIFIADVGHYESEIKTKELLSSILIKNITGTKVLESKINTNPIYYYR
jgi:dinuclear metal center YbgI/SA1388 family protein